MINQNYIFASLSKDFEIITSIPVYKDDLVRNIQFEYACNHTSITDILRPRYFIYCCDLLED